MVSFYTSHVHRLLSKLGRLKILHFMVFSVVSLLALLICQPHKAEASLGDLLPVKIPILSQSEPQPSNTPAPQQTETAQPTQASVQATPTPEPSLLEVVVPQVDLGLPNLEVKIPETKVLEVKVPDGDNVLPQLKVELPTVEVPKVDLPLVSLPQIQVNLPAISTPKVESTIPVLPVVIAEPKPVEIKVPQILDNVTQSAEKHFENPTSIPTQTPTLQHIEPTLQPISTNAATATPATLKPDAIVKESDKLEITEPINKTPVISKPMDISKSLKLPLKITNDANTVKATKVPLPYEDQRPYRFPIEAVWVNTTSSAGNSNGSVSTSGTGSIASQVFIINDADTTIESSSSRVYYTIFAKSDQWAQAPPGQPPKDFSSQPKKSK